ncbi:MAG: thiamine diphosphokinase [Fidelibacterota bacterium]
MDSSFQQPIVILANGQFPRHLVPLNILDSAGTVICTDGSADILQKFNRIPHVIIGDLDSTQLKNEAFKGLWIPVPDQNKTDLQKTLEWCLINRLNDVIVLGATGKREDHSLGNLHILAEFSPVINIHFVSDYSSIYCFKGKQSFQSKKGQLISIVAVEPVKSISTTGLKYSLNQEPFPPACNGISNEAVGNKFTIDTNGSIWLFINHLNS